MAIVFAVVIKIPSKGRKALQGSGRKKNSVLDPEPQAILPMDHREICAELVNFVSIKSGLTTFAFNMV